MSTTTEQVQHTPGPWRHDQDECAVIADAATDRFGCTPVMVVSLEGAMGGDDSTADARLIAAAPDLLAALVGLLGLGGPTAQALEWTLDAEYPDEAFAAVAAARAAIAKAEGRVAATPTPESAER